jgi:hypothetical protein
MGKIVTYEELQHNSTKNSLYVLLHAKGAFSSLPRLIYVVTCCSNFSVRCYKVHRRGMHPRGFLLDCPLTTAFVSTQVEMM